MQALFDELWGVGLPFVEGGGDGTEKAVSEDRMREVVTLLARGLKDDAIARRLGVSVRTVRRLISATIDDLQADSRFQAGVVAVQRGWVAGASELLAADGLRETRGAAGRRPRRGGTASVVRRPARVSCAGSGCS